jgi:hypothetical protein
MSRLVGDHRDWPVIATPAQPLDRHHPSRPAADDENLLRRLLHRSPASVLGRDAGRRARVYGSIDLVVELRRGRLLQKDDDAIVILREHLGALADAGTAGDATVVVDHNLHGLGSSFEFS